MDSMQIFQWVAEGGRARSDPFLASGPRSLLLVGLDELTRMLAERHERQLSAPSRVGLYSQAPGGTFSGGTVWRGLASGLPANLPAVGEWLDEHAAELWQRACE